MAHRYPCASSAGEARGSCYHQAVENRTEPRTIGQWIRYILIAAIALLLVWMMLRVYVL